MLKIHPSSLMSRHEYDRAAAEGVVEIPVDPDRLSGSLSPLAACEASEVVSSGLRRAHVEYRYADGRAYRVITTGRPTQQSSQENNIMSSTSKPQNRSEVDWVDDAPVTAEAALDAITDSGAPRQLNSFEQSGWGSAQAILRQWIDDNGSPLHVTTADDMAAAQMRATPSLPRLKAKQRVQKAMKDIATDRDLTVASVQLGSDPGSDPVIIFSCLPETTRLAQSGYEVVAFVYWPRSTYTFDDGSVVYGKYDGMYSGVARQWKDGDDALEAADELRKAVRELESLRYDAADDPFADDDGKVERKSAPKHSVL